MCGIRTPRFVACAGIAALVLVPLVAACGGEPDVGTGSRSNRGGGRQVTVVGIEWQLVETSVGGTTTAVPVDLDAVVRFDGDGGWSAHGCNFLGGGVEIEGMRLSFADDVTSTAMGCAGPEGEVDTAVTAVLRGGVDAAIDDEGLTLTRSGGDRLRFVERDGIFPSRTMTSLDEGTRGEGDYRFGYESGGGRLFASWEFRSAPGSPWGFAGCATPSDPHQLDPIGGGAAEEPVTFVFGFIGADVARVAYEPPSGEPTDLELYALGADFPEWQAYGGFVEQPVAGSYLVAYDTAGGEVGRSVDLRWP
jgi:heat shock protein HslJ